MRKFLAFIFMLGLYSPFASATVYTLVWCNGCNDAYKEAAAKGQVGVGQGGTIYVGDVNTHTVRAYVITSQIIADDGEGNPVWKKYAVETTPVQANLAAVNSLMAFYDLAPVGWAKTQIISYPGGPNVYNVNVPGPAQNALLTFVQNSSQAYWAEVAHGFIGLMSLIHVADVSSLPTVVYIVEMVDGSTIKVKLDLTTSVPTASMVKDSGIDAYHNTVLSAKRDTPIQFDTRQMTNADLTAWTSQLTALGYTGVSSARGVWACVKAGSTWYCEFVPL